MYSFLYLIKNDFFPENVYKIDITNQNKKQLQKQYNKYYLNNIKILYSTIINNKNEIKKLFEKNNFFIKNDNINQIKKKINNIISKTNNNDINILNLVKKFINISCYEKKGEKYLLNDIYNLYISNNKKIDYIHFLYLIKKCNFFVSENDGKYYINNFVVKHHNKNLYEEFITSLNKYNNFVSINFLINNYKIWHNKNYVYLKIPHKSELKNNLIKYTQNIYGQIKYNPINSFGWII